MSVEFKLITGLAGCGKSAVSDFLRNHNENVIDSDSYVKELYKTSTRLQRQAVEIFGEEIYKPLSGELDTALLAKCLFDENEQKKREAFMLRVNKELISNLKEKFDCEQTIYIEAAPIKEIGMLILDLNIKDVIWVESNKEIQIERLKSRNKPIEYWNKVLEYQNIENLFDYRFVKNYLHLTFIKNNGTLEDLRNTTKVKLNLQ